MFKDALMLVLGDGVDELAFHFWGRNFGKKGGNDPKMGVLQLT